MKDTLNDEKLKEKFTEDDKKVIEDTSKEAIQWVEANVNAQFEEIEAKLKELESKFNPIMKRVYQAAGGPPGGVQEECKGIVGTEAKADAGKPTDEHEEFYSLI